MSKLGVKSQDKTEQDRTGQVKTGQDGRGFWWILKAKLGKKKTFQPSKVTHGDARRGMQSMSRPRQAEQGHSKARASSRAGGGSAPGGRQAYKDGSLGGVPEAPGP